MNKPLPLIEKYRAKFLSEIKGQDEVIQELQAFLKTFPKKKALILNGPVGTGKTSLALALAREHNLELFELNASDLRNRSKLEEVLKPSLEQKSLFNKGKLILMDEADGITGSDRGGLPELLVLINRATFPIIITANNIWQKKFSLLRKKCQLINVKEVNDKIVLGILNNILQKENKKIKLETINTIIRKSRGDVRAALNDLQTILELGEDSYVSSETEREKQESIFDALKKIFQLPPNEKTTSVFNGTKMELNEILLWVEENIPLAYQGSALAKAQFSLSLADLFKGRIYRQQYWRFLVYQNFFLSAGIASATKLKYQKFSQYRRPKRVLKIWLANRKNAKRKSIVAKYAKYTHMSKKKANKENYLLPLILSQAAQQRLDLEEKEQIYLQEKRGAIIIANNLNRFRA